MTNKTFSQRNTFRLWSTVFILAALFVPLSACYFPWLDPVDAQLRSLIERHGLTGDPSIGRDIPSINDPLAQLGMKLFFTKALGGDEDAACASCHLPTLGGGDGLSLPIGVGATDPDLVGPGRAHPSGGPTVPRNSPTTFNVALWDGFLFHDGRVESLGKTAGSNGADGLGIRTPDSVFGTADPLAGSNLVMAQARFPVTSRDEMFGFSLDVNTNQDIRNQLADRLEKEYLDNDELDQSNSWRTEFEEVFGAPSAESELITEQRIAQAIAAYERSQLFIDTPWKAYVQGDDAAIDATAKQGALLFFRSVEEGGANCASCHAGDFFTDEQFHVLAIPQLGPGKGDGFKGLHDYGRYRETGSPDDQFAFRTPSLINVAVTGPYGHDGAYSTLDGIIRHMLNPAEALESYDFGQLDVGIDTEYCVENTQMVLDKLEENRLTGIPSVDLIDLADSEIDALVSFLHTLTDPCTQDTVCLSPWMPEVDSVDMETFQLINMSK